MQGMGRRRLRIETLESRRVLNGDPLGVCLAPQPLVTPSPPPPAGQDAVDAVVVTSYSTNHVRVRDTSGGVFMQIDGRRNPANGFPTAFMTGDFNGDEVTDLLSADDVGDWWLYLNDGVQLHERSVGVGLNNVNHLGTADFNQDGRLDIVSFDPTAGELWVSVNTPNGFEHQNWGEFANPNGWSSLHVGDFSGDGRVDVLGGEAGGHWWLAQNNGGTDFDNYRWGRYADFNWVDTLSGEFTGDEHSDIVARAPDNTWWLWEGSATGFVGSRYFGHWKMRGEWQDVSTGDFNGDQIDDVIGRSNDGRLWVGTASTTGFQTWSWATGWIDSANWSQVTVMDINGDGMDDQVGHADDDTWWYALSKNGRFQNEFWQKGGEGDFVSQGFQTDAVLDVSASFVDVEDIPAPRPKPKPDVAAADGFVSVADGRLVLNGTFLQFAGLEVVSQGGYLSLETVEIPPLGDVPLANPFGPAEGIIVVNEAHSVVIGVLGAARRIDIDGETITSILYAGPAEFAAADLTVHIGIGDNPPAPLGVGQPDSTDVEASHNTDPVVETPQVEVEVPISKPVPESEPETPARQPQPHPEADASARYVSLTNGHLVLNGSYDGLAGIEVISIGGFLSLDSMEVPGIGELSLKTPFDQTASVVENTPNAVVMGILGADRRINIDGETATAISYAGPVESLASDLTVNVGIGNSAPTSLKIGV